MELNSKKTQLMVVSRSNERPPIKMFTDRNKLKQRDQFKYLGTLISSDGRKYTEIASKIVEAKITFQRKSRLTKNHISIHTRKRALQCYIEPILMYGCKAWTISKQRQEKLSTTELWFHESHGQQRNQSKQYSKTTLK